MNTEEFFAFCQDRRNNGGKANKEVAILTVWSFLYGQHRTKEEIEHYIDKQINESRDEQPLIDAYIWLKGVLTEGTL
jgi:hypothetical protein